MEQPISQISNKVLKTLLLIGLLFLLFYTKSNAQTVTPWLTKGDQTKLLSQEPNISFGTNSGTNSTTITINPNTTFQSIEGFGFTLTQGSAEVISGMNATQQSNLLNELFNPTTGLGISALRISIAASDLSSSNYSYNEVSGDVNMTNFSLNGPDLTYLIPILKKILLINPTIKILATPWSPPRWMKDNNSWIGGRLQTSAYTAYANYFVKYCQAMQAQGINIWAITPQNEPENPHNNPSMLMNATEQKNFINNNLGPAMANAGFGNIKIIAFDHNCDNTAYPIDVCNNSTYVDGAAFHLYAGNISAMSTVKNATNKNVYFTEQFTSTTGNFSGDLGWHMQNVVTGSLNNWSKTVFEWNLANNASFGPYTNGGCTTCLGALTINNDGSYHRNVAYYIIGQISKFVKPNALRIETSSSSTAIFTSGFKNQNGAVAVLAYNSRNTSQNIKLIHGSNAFDYTIPANSAVTFVWQDGQTQNIPVTGISVSPTSSSIFTGENTQLLETVSPNNATNKAVTWTSSNTNVATVSNTGVVTGIATGTATITVNTVDGNQTATTTVTVTANNQTGFIGYYNILSRNSNKGLDVADNASNSGARIQQYDVVNGGGNNQRWKFEDAGNGNYYIKVKSTQMCLVPEKNGPNNGVKIVQKPQVNSNAYKWTVSSLGNGFYKIINVNSGKSLDVEGVSTANGANIQVWDYSNNLNQQWQFNQIESTTNKEVTDAISSIENENITVFLNPDTNILSITSKINQDGKMIVCTTSGKRIVTKDIRLENKNKETLDMSSLAQGIYIIKIENEGHILFKKVIKR